MIKLTKKHIGKIVRTCLKKRRKFYWYGGEGYKNFVTGRLVSSPHFDIPFLDRLQVWYGPKDWIWLENSCDKRTFKILSEEETIIWKLEHNM